MARPRKKTSFYKICNMCGRELSLDNYYKDGVNARGTKYRNECKECYKKHRLEMAAKKTFEEFPIKHIQEDTNENSIG